MQKLVSGIHQFQHSVFSQHKQLFERLAEGVQTPQALFITCSDSRINPNLLTQTDPGELFILRNAGCIVPPYGAISGAEAGTIEYAVSVLKVRDIVICGHSHCGAMASLLEPQRLDELPAVKSWLGWAETARRIIKENYSHVTDSSALLTAMIEENVLVQLEHLRTHPSVAAALARHDLALHGWVYKFETGQVFTFDPVAEQFVSLAAQPRTTRAAGGLPSI